MKKQRQKMTTSSSSSSSIIIFAYLLLICNTFGFAAKLLGEIKRIEALLGGKVMMPCDVTSSNTNDTLLLLVWYKGNKPFYSYDGRLLKHWRSADFYQNDRIIFTFHTEPAALLMDKVNLDDDGTYRCRADFSLTPTRNIGIYLFVVIVPSKPFFMDEIGTKVENRVGPFQEGDLLILICLAVGGKPIPKLSWWKSNTLLDSSDEPSEVPGVRENQLMLTLTREFAGARIQCLASNNNITVPLSSSLEIELYVSPETVSILSSKQALSADNLYELPCYVNGSYPLPEVSWYLDGKLITDYKIVSESTYTEVISTLYFKPKIAHNGKDLTCLATNKILPPKLASKLYTTTLNIFFAPVVSLTLVTKNQRKYVIEGENVQFRCMVEANPWITNTEWFGNNRTIKGSILNGSQIMITSSDLIILNVKKQHIGNYSCIASNLEGFGRSNVLQLRISHKPVCLYNTSFVYDETNLTCPIASFPNANKFYWKLLESNKTFRFNNNSIDLHHFYTNTSLTNLNDVNITCWAENEIGLQDNPCTIILTQRYIIPVPPRDCRAEVVDNTIKINCQKVNNISIDSLFCISVWKNINNTKFLVNNITSPIPDVIIENLEEESYEITLYAFNKWGKSEIIKFTNVQTNESQSPNYSTMNAGMLAGVLVGITLTLTFLTLILVFKKRKKELSNNIKCDKAEYNTKNKSKKERMNKSVNADLTEKPLLSTCTALSGTPSQQPHKTESKTIENINLVQMSSECIPTPPKISRNNKPKLPVHNTFINPHVNTSESTNLNHTDSKQCKDTKYTNGIGLVVENAKMCTDTPNLKMLNMSKESIV